VTATRLAVLAALQSRPHSPAEVLFGEVREQLGSIAPQSIYNILSSFVEAGLARRIEPAGSPPLYELRVGDNHHHVVCRKCGAVVDVDCVVGERPCLKPSDTSGYSIDEADITFWGICPACQGASGPHETGGCQLLSGMDDFASAERKCRTL